MLGPGLGVQGRDHGCGWSGPLRPVGVIRTIIVPTCVSEVFKEQKYLTIQSRSWQIL